MQALEIITNAITTTFAVCLSRVHLCANPFITHMATLTHKTIQCCYFKLQAHFTRIVLVIEHPHTDHHHA